MTKVQWFDKGVQSEREVIVTELLAEAAKLNAEGNIKLSKYLAGIALRIRDGFHVTQERKDA